MKSTLIAQDSQALQYIKEGVDIIYGAVRRTLGPEARTTLMYRTYNRGPRNVDDGFYTAEVIVPKNPFVRLASEFFKEATMRTNRRVGDGTSATTVVAGVLFNEVHSNIQEKAQGYGKSSSGVMALKKEILSEAKEVKEQIRKVSKPVQNLETLENIASVSLGESNDVSKIIANMAFEVGVDGFIDVVEGYKGEIETEVIKGMRFPAKVCDKAFVNKPERYEMVVDDCPVLVTNHKIDNDLMLRYLVEEVIKETKFCIIAPDFSTQVLISMALSRKNGTFIWPVKVPSLRTEQLEDIAVYCGATLVDKNKGRKLQNFSRDMLGHFEKLTVKDSETREDAVLLGGNGTKEIQLAEKKGKGEQTTISTNAVQERIKVLRGQLEETKDPGFQKLIERRIASMASAGGVIRVGAPTDAESLPLKLKIEDVVYACRAALRGGYVKGGGLCLKEISDSLEEGHVLKKSLLSPYLQIQENAGGNLEIPDEIIDPTDAVYYTVEHATSVVASLITVGNLIPEEPEIESGEGEMKLAEVAKRFVYFWARKEGILNESEKAMMDDARMGMNEDEWGMTRQE